MDSDWRTGREWETEKEKSSRRNPTGIPRIQRKLSLPEVEITSGRELLHTSRAAGKVKKTLTEF